MGRAGAYGGGRSTVTTMPSVRQDVVVLTGGWDQITPTNELPPGTLRDVQNFECAATGFGYSRIVGYERPDRPPHPPAPHRPTAPPTGPAWPPGFPVLA